MDLSFTPMQVFYSQHLVRLGIVLHRPKSEPGAYVFFAAACLLHAQKPDIGIEGTVADVPILSQLGILSWFRVYHNIEKVARYAIDKYHKISYLCNDDS